LTFLVFFLSPEGMINRCPQAVHIARFPQCLSANAINSLQLGQLNWIVI
jgi:hypothetical protein